MAIIRLGAVSHLHALTELSNERIYQQVLEMEHTCIHTCMIELTTTNDDKYHYSLLFTNHFMTIDMSLVSLNLNLF